MKTFRTLVLSLVIAGFLGAGLFVSTPAHALINHCGAMSIYGKHCG